MRSILITTDPVRLCWAESVLAGAGIGYRVLDEHMSVLEGSIGALPRRLAVADEDAAVAIRALALAERELPE